jgi:hypothetical protein
VEEILCACWLTSESSIRRSVIRRWVSRERLEVVDVGILRTVTDSNRDVVIDFNEGCTACTHEIQVSSITVVSDNTIETSGPITTNQREAVEIIYYELAETGTLFDVALFGQIEVDQLRLAIVLDPCGGM